LHCSAQRLVKTLGEPGQRQPDTLTDQPHFSQRPLDRDRIGLKEQIAVQTGQTCVNLGCFGAVTRKVCGSHRMHRSRCHIRGNGYVPVCPQQNGLAGRGIVPGVDGKFR